MLPISLADLEVAMRVLLAQPASARKEFANTIITQASEATSFRASTRLGHVSFGNGTLMSAAAQYPMSRRPGYCDAEYLTTLAMLAQLLATHQNR